MEHTSFSLYQNVFIHCLQNLGNFDNDQPPASDCQPPVNKISDSRKHDCDCFYVKSAQCNLLQPLLSTAQLKMYHVTSSPIPLPCREPCLHILTAVVQHHHLECSSIHPQYFLQSSHTMAPSAMADVPKPVSHEQFPDNLSDN